MPRRQCEIYSTVSHARHVIGLRLLPLWQHTLPLSLHFSTSLPHNQCSKLQTIKSYPFTTLLLHSSKPFFSLPISNSAIKFACDCSYALVLITIQLDLREPLLLDLEGKSIALSNGSAQSHKGTTPLCSFIPFLCFGFLQCLVRTSISEHSVVQQQKNVRY